MRYLMILAWPNLAREEGGGTGRGERGLGLGGGALQLPREGGGRRKRRAAPHPPQLRLPLATLARVGLEPVS